MNSSESSEHAQRQDDKVIEIESREAYSPFHDLGEVHCPALQVDLPRLHEDRTTAIVAATADQRAVLTASIYAGGGTSAPG